MAWYTREHLLAEYKAVASLQTSTVNLRFVTLGAFIALNGFLLTAYGFLLVHPLDFSRQLLSGTALLIIFANAAFVWLERRTDQSHVLIMHRGRGVELGLSIENGVFTQSVAARGRVTPHTKILQRMYLWMGGIGIVLVAASLFWFSPAKTKEELAIAVKATITQEFDQFKQQLSSELKGVSDQIAAEGKKTSQEM